jgi:hypothetical protein
VPRESSSHSFSRERSVMMLRFACSERNGSVVIAVPPDHLRRRVKGSPYLYWRGALRYSASIVSKKAVQSRQDESGVSVGAAQKTFLPKTFQESCVFF